ncbi:coil containing protein [Vibrio phage 1.081.O._10N.286.52.C2]|nr:coil containing protein [Vibrio phage 1.081.O._10N.286.52.C2]
MTKYKILMKDIRERDELENEVAKYLNDGWQLHGPLIATAENNNLIQVVIKTGTFL